MGDNKNTEIGTRTEGEVLSKRNAYSQTFAEPDGSFTTECTIGERFWYDKYDKLSETKYKPIEIGFIKSEMPGYEWANVANSFNFHFKRNLNDDVPYIFNKETSSIGFKSVYMGYCEFDFVSGDFNIKTLQSLYRPNDSIGYITERDVAFADEKPLKKERLVYEDFYTDCDFMYESNNDGVKEFIRIKSRDNLIEPARLGLNNDNTFLVFLTEIDVDGVDTVKDNSKEIDETKRFNRIDYTVGDDIIFSMPDLKVWEEDKEDEIIDLSKFKVYTSKQSIIYIDGKMHLLYGVSYNDLLEVESYPLIFDPTINVNVSNELSVLHYTDNTNQILNNGSVIGNYLFPGGEGLPPGGNVKGIAFLPFSNISVPKNAIISDAVVAPQVLIPLGSPTIVGKGVPGGLPPIPDYLYGIWMHGGTTAYSISPNWASNMTTVVQEIVNSSNWASGNTLYLMFSSTNPIPDGGYVILKPSVQGSPYTYISITYTEGITPLNATGPISMGGSTVGQSINLRLGNAATATINLNTTAVRTLAGKPTGAIDLNSFHGK